MSYAWKDAPTDEDLDAHARIAADVLLDSKNEFVRLEAIKTVRKDFIRPPESANINILQGNPEMFQALLASVRARAIPVDTVRILPAEDCVSSSTPLEPSPKPSREQTASASWPLLPSSDGVAPSPDPSDDE